MTIAEERPGRETGAEMVGETTFSVIELVNQLDDLTGLPPDLAAFRHGFECGWIVGHADGVDSADARWNWAIAGVQRLADRPDHAELEAKRAEGITEPCTDQSCLSRSGRCSRCVRAGAVSANRERYGTDDYPGAKHG